MGRSSGTLCSEPTLTGWLQTVIPVRPRSAPQPHIRGLCSLISSYCREGLIRDIYTSLLDTSTRYR